MRYLISLLVTVFFAGSVLAGQCPSLVKEIDQQLKMSKMESEAMSKVKMLRDEGQSLHQQGKHAESVKVLKKAMDELEAMGELEGEA